MGWGKCKAARVIPSCGLDSNLSFAEVGTRPSVKFCADNQGRVIVDIYLDGTTTVDEAIKSLEAQGCRIESRVDWYGHGALAVWLPLVLALDCHSLCRRR